MKTFNANSFHIILVVSLFFCSCSNGLLNTTLNPSGGENGLKTWSVSENSSAGFCDTVEGRSGFRCINRRNLRQCLDLNPYLEINVGTQGPLKDEENVTVTVSGVLHPSDRDWVALISPSTASISDCPQSAILYKQTGDIKSSPLLCHYPVKAQFLKNDPSYKSCKNSKCHVKLGRKCLIKTCTASLTFHVVNIRTEIKFVFFSGGFAAPCIHKRSKPLVFSNPQMPLYGHLSSVDSTGTSMRLTWISGSNLTQSVQYGDGKSTNSNVTTFSRADMCETKEFGSPAKDFGWHDPGYIHTAVMTGLLPSHNYVYKYGSVSVGWSSSVNFSTPPASGSSELRFLAYGDMGKAPRDASYEHYIQPGSLGVIQALTDEVASGNVDSVFHIGDISYATGFLVEWDYFLHLITPFASRISYMTAIGNHERDYPDSMSMYHTPDSGGECGVPYEKYFPMPTPKQDKPWYSISQGPVHFTVMSTEHNWSANTEQYEWIKQDLASVDRKKTPWIIFTGHRPMYSSRKLDLVGLIIPGVDPAFAPVIEPLLLANQVDLVLWGHVHNYERTCAVFQKSCKAFPTKGVSDGIDTYNNTVYSAPVHAIIGMAGFSLDEFRDHPHDWSLVRFSEYGYTRINVTTQQLVFEFVSSETRTVKDAFKIIKPL